MHKVFSTYYTHTLCVYAIFNSQNPPQLKKKNPNQNQTEENHQRKQNYLEYQLKVSHTVFLRACYLT